WGRWVGGGARGGRAGGGGGGGQPAPRFPPAAPRVVADAPLRPGGPTPRREARCGRQVSAQRRELAVGARGQRLLQPLVELFGGQPAIARGYPQQFSSPVPVLV